jgi:hypothetical protein
MPGIGAYSSPQNLMDNRVIDGGGGNAGRFVDDPKKGGTKTWVPAHTPPRAAITNIETAEVFDFQFNPPEFTESFSANYARHQIPGLGYQVMQYINTNNNQISFDIYLSGIVPFLDAFEGVRVAKAQTVEEVYDIARGKQFLQSLLYPSKSQSGGWRAPPRCLFVWPKVVRMMCVLVSLDFTHQRFSSKDLRTTALTANVTLEELVESQRFSNDVRNLGSRQTKHTVVVRQRISSPKLS